jgi:two-component system, chemotaxis family, sensor kinase CheA
MDNDFQKRLLATFKVETREHLTALSAGLIELEQAAEQEKRQKILETVFREAHSLKGAARSVNMAGIESLSHALESVFAAFKREECAPSAALFDLLHRTIDTIDTQLLSIETGQNTAAKARARELIASLAKAVKGAPASAPPPVPPPAEYRENTPPEKPAGPDTVRIPASKLDVLLHQVEEMVTAKLTLRQRAAELDEINAALAAWEKEWKKTRPAVRRLRKMQQAPAGGGLSVADAGQLGKLLTFSDWSHAAVKSLERQVHTMAKALALDRYTLNGMVDNLLDDMKEVLMLPCATVLEVLPRMVRELARDYGKDAELVIAGEAVEIDKRILEELKDPLIHLVRNCIDHGIEMPAQRQRLDKPERGRISVTVTLKESSRVEMVIADDGAGIDTVRVADVVVQQGLVSQDEASRLERDELLGLVFASGISTAPLITDISGRGLGLAIVREKVEKLGGTVTVASEPRHGTTFRMMLPLTLSTYRGMLVRLGDQTFIVPAAAVERVARIAGAALRTVENRETVELDGSPLSFAWLADILHLPRTERNGDDGILAEQEILVKGLGPQLTRVRNIAGATVLGTGKVATILHLGDLVKSAVKGAGVAAGAARPAEKGEAPRKSVLIVEDSITARTLLKNILETAGYRTSTAMDGIDALTQLRTETIDLVVSDVDMPRMNGFELTAQIRGSREFADLPLVLVTSLDSREDRERGIEVGANAYIVKSSFDQSNLLEVVKRLL